MSDQVEGVTSRRLPTAAPNGELARVLLAFLATAGIFYVNIMPAIVDGLIEGLNFSNRDAGLVGSANTYGAAFGAFTVVFYVKRMNWRRSATRSRAYGWPSCWPSCSGRSWSRRS